MTDNIPKINFSRLFRIWSDHKVDTLNEFRLTVDHSLSLEEGRLEEKLAELETNRDKYSEDDYEDYKGHLTIDYQDLDLIKNIRDELSIIALYKTVELYMKRILARAFHGKVKTEKIMNLNIKGIADLFKKKNIALNSIRNYDAINELRVINNAIKHESRVTSELSKFEGWKKGDELSKLDVTYNRIAPLLPEFVEELSQKAFNS